MTNQKETSQPESSAIAFIFTLFSQAFEDRHFTEREISFCDGYGGEPLRPALDLRIFLGKAVKITLAGVSSALLKS